MAKCCEDTESRRMVGQSNLAIHTHQEHATRDFYFSKLDKIYERENQDNW